VVPAPSVAPATPAQLTVSLAPTIGSQLEVERGKAGYVTIGNAGGAIGSFTITGGGLAVSMPQGTVQPGATVTVNVTDTAGTDRVTFLDVRGSGFAQRYEVLVR
jgi:hypothetical protein